VNIIDAMKRSEWSNPHVIIVMGKGGVGKTTVSIRIAVELADKGMNVLLASLDPAAHMMKYLGLPRPLIEKRVLSGITAIQYSIEPLAKKLSEDYSLLLKRLIPSLNALASFDIASAIRESPGFEEEVFLRIMEELYSREGVDAVIVDTPPTGVALRVLRLPDLYGFWLSRLRELRERIIATKYAIARALGKGGDVVNDPVLRKLETLENKYRKLGNELRNPARTSLVIVATPEPLPVHEARKVMEEAVRLRIRVEAIVANRVLGERAGSIGVGEIEADSLREIEEIRCLQYPPPGVVHVMHSLKPPSRLSDVVEMGGLINVANVFGHGC